MRPLVVIRNLGLLLVVTSGAILVVAAWSCLQWLLGDETEKAALQALMMTVACGGIVGMLLWFVGRRARHAVGRRDAILLVATSWFVAAAVGALPYRLWPTFAEMPPDTTPFANYVDCYFEAMSGLTTTGATVLTSIESLPRSLHLWRSLTHWLGGLGIVVLFVAVLPMLGVGGKRLFRVEAPGPTPDGVTPRIQETARVLWLIYLGLTVIEIIVLKLVGLTWFESVCHTFATLATGGFSTLNASVAGYQSVAIDVVIIIFMVAAGVNFGLYFQLIKGRWRSVVKDREFRCYIGFLTIGSILVVASIVNRPIVATDGTEIQAGIGDAMRYGIFQVVAVQTTTGFCTADFDLWPFLPKFAMICLMFVGGSAGSTGGGMKVIRFMMAFKILWAELERVFQPNVVRPVRIGTAVIDTEMKLATMVYFVGIAVLTLLGMVLLMLLESGKDIDSITALTASIATLNNIGPGLAKVGATCNFGWFTSASKGVMIVLMALGRLEVMTIAVLFFPRFWRGD